jgi:ligand-binding sensor domain-containing protein
MFITRKIKLLGVMIFLLAAFQLRAEITFTPAEPVVEMEGRIELSVSGMVGELIWSAINGFIEGTGTTVTYIAPAQPGWDVVTVTDAEINAATLKIQVVNPNPESKDLSLENANWEVFTNRDTVHALALSKDKKTLWVGTGGGLEKRRASTGELKKVYMKNTDDLPSNDVSALLSDEQGGVWVGTDNGLARLKADGLWQDFFNKNNSNLPDNRVQALLSDDQGGVWVGTNLGLAHLKADGSWLVFNAHNSNLPYNHVYALLSDDQGGIWVGTNLGLAHFKNDGSWLVFNTHNSNLPYNTVKSLSSDDQGGIWLGTNRGGFAHLKKDGSWQVFNKDNSDMDKSTTICSKPNSSFII